MGWYKPPGTTKVPVPLGGGQTPAIPAMYTPPAPVAASAPAPAPGSTMTPTQLLALHCQGSGAGTADCPGTVSSSTSTSVTTSGLGGGQTTVNGVCLDANGNLCGTGQPPSSGNTQPAPLPFSSAGSPPDNPGLTSLSFAQVENFWIQAGGSPQAAAMAAAVADAESGLNAAAERTNPDGSVGVGLWLIPQNGTPPGSTDPVANARAAVQLSQNGTDWTQWCSTWSDNNCGENNGTYLGQGANALMSLAGQKPGAAYNVFGATPSSTGVGASSATSGLTSGSTSTGKSKTLLLLGGLVIGVILIWFLVNRKKQQA